jgi:transcriptional regulator with XRE-family HTH domain
MKKYNSLGELLIDYRAFNNLSQTDFAFKIGVDVRTVQRWERGVTLIKSEKEEEIVLQTLLPYQLVRNLNATVPIPTFYDFRIRKYSLNELSTELPDALWFKSQLDIKTNRLRLIDFDFDIRYIIHYIDSQKNDNSYVNTDLIREAVRLAPELNFVLTDDSGYYAGHSLILPIKKSVYEDLKRRKIRKEDLRFEHLCYYKDEKRPVFFNYDITADCNDNIFYLVCEFLRFFRDINQDYLFCTYTERYDSYKLSVDSGMELIWEDQELQTELGLEVAPRFMEGTYDAFLDGIE